MLLHFPLHTHFMPDPNRYLKCSPCKIPMVGLLQIKTRYLLETSTTDTVSDGGRRESDVAEAMEAAGMVSLPGPVPLSVRGRAQRSRALARR